MNKKIFNLLFIPLLLSGCGVDALQCADNIAEFPDSNKPNYNIREEKDFIINNPNLVGEDNEQLYVEFDKVPSDITKGAQTAIEFANNTSIQRTANINNNLRYPKMFDGVISCSGSNANSRLGLYSEGVVVEFPKLVDSMNYICLYMSHSFLNLKMSAMVTLFKNTSNIHDAREFDAYNFHFDTHLGTSVLGPKFFLLDLTKIMENVDELTDIQMVGFKYTRLTLTEEEKSSERYYQYIETLEEEKSIEQSQRSFVKMYDISFPFSTWKN